GAEKVLAELIRIVFGHLAERDAAGVGRDYRARASIRDYTVKQGALDIQVFGNGLDDPIAVFDFWEIGVEATGSDQARIFGEEKSRRAALQCRCETVAGRRCVDIE